MKILNLKKENDEYNKNESYKWRYDFEEMVAAEIEDTIKEILHDSKKIGEIGIYGVEVRKYKDGSLKAVMQNTIERLKANSDITPTNGSMYESSVYPNLDV